MSADSLQDDFEFVPLDTAPETAVEIEDDSENQFLEPAFQEPQPKKQKKKRRKKMKEDQVVPTNARDQIAMLWQLFMDYLKREKKQTSIEMEAIGSKYSVSGANAIDTVDFDRERDDDNMEQFIQFIVKDWHKVLSVRKKEAKGKPKVVILCQSAIRCVQVIRLLPELHDMCRIGKMFTKHLKITEQVEYLKQKAVKIVVGTPARIAALHKETEFLSDCEYFVFDMWKSSKEMTILELKDCRKELFDGLMPVILDSLQQGKAKISMY